MILKSLQDKFSNTNVLGGFNMNYKIRVFHLNTNDEAFTIDTIFKGEEAAEQARRKSRNSLPYPIRICQSACFDNK